MAFCIPHDEAALAATLRRKVTDCPLPAGSPLLLAIERPAKTLIGAVEATDGAHKPGVFSRLISAMGR